MNTDNPYESPQAPTFNRRRTLDKKGVAYVVLGSFFPVTAAWLRAVFVIHERESSTFLTENVLPLLLLPVVALGTIAYAHVQNSRPSRA